MRSVTANVPDNKTCSHCNENKQITEFSLAKTSPDGLQPQCKSCRNLSKHKWRIARRDVFDKQAKKQRQKKQHWLTRDKLQFNIRQRKYRLKREYGLTEEEFQSMLVENEGRCQCCGRVPGPEGWAIDHDHKSGEIRGLVCKSCNAGIGLLGDTLERVQLAADYLSGIRHACLT